MSAQQRMQQQMEQQVVQATKVIESQIDNEIEKLDHLDNRGLEQIRKKRIQEMQDFAKKRETWLANGHGKYYEVSMEKEVFNEVKLSKNVVIHFYRDSTFRCSIVDKHLQLLAPKHVECKFIKINAEKAPFLTDRLKVRVIPTIVIVNDEAFKDFIIGFDELGGHDEFSTEMMEWRIAQSGVLVYKGDLMRPPDDKSKKVPKGGPSGIFGVASKKRNVRDDEDDIDDDEDW